ncbi:MAG: class I SAM-dependent methyltransferase [Ferruginibacter sp.]
MDLLQTLLNERPRFHKGETEIQRHFAQSETMLSSKEMKRLEQDELTCYGVEKEVLSFLYRRVEKGSKTLETGAGCSTLIFAHCGANHLAVTPAASEIELIKKYAAEKQVSMDNVRFRPQSSDVFLPAMEEDGFDLILLDGKHAFPWPIIDWFYTADKLKKDGLMLIDDAEMKSVSILVDFMLADSAWEMVQDFSGKTIIFKKLKDSVHDVAWHMQPYTYVKTGLMQKISNKIKTAVSK